jgi:glutamyl-Q tRNA(Asp) synthetase
LGSALEAGRRGGEWLVRLEDLDRPREVPGAADTQLQTLEAFGFTWDGPVVRQSQRIERYRAALDGLRARDLVYECSCTRATIARDLGVGEAAAGDIGYPGTCRDGPSRPGSATATRLHVHRMPSRITFTDLFQGTFEQDVNAAVGDFIVRRRDGIYAYQLAVVVDDAAQGITDVVRGYDLLDNTPRQILLQRALSLPEPRYGHLPLVVEPDGTKLAKSRRSIPLDPAHAPQFLWTALTLLQHQPPDTLKLAAVSEIWSWARSHWDPLRLLGRRAVPAP